MSKKPLISILTPAYNPRRYISQTIRSILSQTYQDWEWIILDDGSTDGTGDIIRSAKDRRIHYYYQEHAGITQLTKTFNKALALCSGDFIAMLDHDDYWPDYKLKVQIESFDNPDTVLSYGVCCLVNQNGRKIMYTSLPDDPSVASNDPIGSALKALVFRRYSFIPNLTVMVRKAALSSIGGFVEAQGLYQDFPTWTRLALEGKFAAIPHCLGFHRKHPSSVTAGADPELGFEIRLRFLRTFIAMNKRRLNELGFHWDTDMLEQRWEEIRKEQIYPYNKAMLLLHLGSFKKAREEFKKFLEKNRSIKNKLIYSLISLSSVINTDLVNPAAEFKKKVRTFFKRTH